MGKWIRTCLAIAALFTCLHGCSKNGGDTAVGPSSAPARFMFVQASPDAPPADLYVDSVRVDSNLAYPNCTKYLDIAAGLRTVMLVRPGGMQPLYVAMVPVTAGWNYTIFGIDSVAKYSSMLLVDNLTAPGAGKASLRFVHASPNSPAADLVIEGSITLFTDKAFKSKTDFIPIDAGTYTFDVKTSGTPTVLASAHDVLLAAGKIYTLYVRGFAGSLETTALDTGLLVHN